MRQIGNALEKVRDGKAITSGEQRLIDEASKPRVQRSFDTFQQAAAALGISAAVLRRAKRNGLPGFSHGRIYPGELLPALQASAAKGINEGLPPDKEALECRRLLAQCERFEFENKVELGKYVLLDQACKFIQEVAEHTKGILRVALEDQLPPVLQGLTAPAIRVHMKALNDQICATMQQYGRQLAQLKK